METLHSGSRVSNEQHLSFRVVWPKCKSDTEIQTLNGTKAREIVKKTAGFQSLLHYIAQAKH